MLSILPTLRGRVSEFWVLVGFHSHTFVICIVFMSGLRPSSVHLFICSFIHLSFHSSRPFLL